MDLPELLPEELLIGYEGRLRTLNYLPESLSIAAALNRVTPGSSAAEGLPKSFLESVAASQSRSVYELVMNHTLWPFTAAMGRPTSPADVEAFIVSRTGRTDSARSTRRGAWLCGDCVNEDLGFRNLSYWRRNHQLPGAVWCDKHRSPLMGVAWNAMGRGEPHHFVDQARRHGELDDLKLCDNRLVADFLQLCVDLLEVGVVLDHSTTSGRIRERAIDQGLVGSAADHGIALYQQLKATAPLPWLLHAFPKIRWLEPQGCATVAAVCRHGTFSVSTAAVLLITSLVSSTSDEALRLLMPRSSQLALASSRGC